MISIDIQVSRSQVKVKTYVSVPHIVQWITQERLAPES